MHLNYDKVYLGRGDLSANTQKLDFLNYIHPNSYQQPVRDTDPHDRYLDKNQSRRNYLSEEAIGN